MRYKNREQIAAELVTNLINNEIGFNELCRKARLEFGIKPEKLTKILEQDYPQFIIENDRVVLR